MLKIQGVKNNEEDGGYIEVPDAEATMFVLYDLSEDGKSSKVLAAFATVEEATAAIAAWEAHLSSIDPSADPVVVDTVDKLAETVVLWHRECNAQIAAIANTPKDVNIKVTIYGKERNLTPSERKAFMEGAKVAGEVFKDLPFQFTEGPVDGE